MSLPRALPFQNLVSVYECGRVFPANVGSGSHSRVAVNWRSSRFSWSVETRRRYGWFRIVLPGARLFRAPIWCPPGGGGTREAGRTVAESLVALYRVGTHQIRRGRRAPRSSMSQGSTEPLCVTIKGANREVSEEKLISDYGMFSSYEGQQGAVNGQEDTQCFGRLDAGSRAGFTSSRPPLPWTSVFHFSLFLHDVCGLQKLELVDQN